MSDQHAKPPITTTDAGAPVASDEHSLTAGPAGPVLLQDAYLNEKLAHFVRERIPAHAGLSVLGGADLRRVGNAGHPSDRAHTGGRDLIEAQTVGRTELRQRRVGSAGPPGAVARKSPTSFDRKSRGTE